MLLKWNEGKEKKEIIYFETYNARGKKKTAKQPLQPSSDSNSATPTP